MVKLATMAPISTCFIFGQVFELDSIRGKMKRSADGQPQTPPNIFNKVFSSHLDPSKTWYALNSQICCGKPSTFCSSGIAKVFAEDYKVVRFADLRDQHGVVPPFKWFNSLNRKSEMVCVATTFGIYVGLMRTKKPEECPLIFGEEFQSIRELINNKGFDSKIHSDLTDRLCDERFSRLESHTKVLEAQLNSAAQELFFLRAKIRKDAIICITGTESPPKPNPPKSSPPKLPSMDSTPPKERPTSIANIKANEELSPVTKKRKVKEKFKVIMNELGIVLESNGETLGSIVTESCLSARERRDDHGVVDAVGMAFKEITRNHGAIKAFETLVPEEAWAKRVEAMQVPDWVSLLAKLKTRLSDSSWQDFTSLTKLGRTGKNGDGDILILKGSLKALRKGIFDVTNSLMGITKLRDCDIHGYEANLESAVVWTAREMRLHGHIPEEIIFNLKVDGRPFFGRKQVSVGMVPINGTYQSCQSAKSVITLVIANCEENRRDLKMLFRNLNIQKNLLKKNGITVDGKRYKVSFKVTLDYKGLVLLFAKPEDEDFVLGGKGLNVEFCIFCLAIRACHCDLGKYEICLEHFSQTKANVGGFKGLRDDLTCILDEDLSSMSLCALHCEMRNTEQLLKSIGLLAYEIGSLDDCNDKLASYGPETVCGNRLKVKTNCGQETKVERHNIKLQSFSGSTERQILEDLKGIVEHSLPDEKMTDHFKDQQSAAMYITNKVIFCQDRIKYYEELLKSGVFVRDFGTRLEKIELNDTVHVANVMKEKCDFWKTKMTDIEDTFKVVYKPLKGRRKKGNSGETNKELSSYAARLNKDFLILVCDKWKTIAEIMREKVFNIDEEHLIDAFDLECKEWGFLLFELFGRSLGTGDFGHLTVDHASMLLRVHRSMKKLSNQGFEASHKLQRQLYLKATSHDAKYISSVQQIFQHMNAEKLLDLRLAFREAKNCIASGKPFYYRSCGWQKKRIDWTEEDKKWIESIDTLFKDIFGPDKCKYQQSKTKTTCLTPGQFPVVNYVHSEWENTQGNLPRIEIKADEGEDNEEQSNQHGNGDCQDDVERDRDNDDIDSTDQGEDNKDLFNQHENGDCQDDEKKDVDTEFVDGCYNQTFISNVGRIPNNSRKGNGSHQDLLKCHHFSLLRGEKAKLKLPNVAHIQTNDIVIVQNPVFSDPLFTKFRPSSSTVKYALEQLSAHQKSVGGGFGSVGGVDDVDDVDDDDVEMHIGVKLGNLGTFSIDSLRLFLKAAEVAEDATRVNEEVKWLSSFSSNHDVTDIMDALHNSRSEDEVLKHGLCIMDTKDLRTLACERYVNGFAIDVICINMLEASQSTSIVYLPSFSQTWARQGVQYFKNHVLSYFSSKAEISLILTPIHHHECQHWGVLCFDIVGKNVYYDDGLKILPPDDIISVIRSMIGGFALLTDKSSEIQENGWNLSLPLPRVGMPKQPRSGDGSASCGVGVILTIRDIIESKNIMPAFKWRFEDMKNLRREIMSSVLAVAGKDL